MSIFKKSKQNTPVAGTDPAAPAVSEASERESGAATRKKVFDGRKTLYRMTLSALFLALALVVKTFGALNIPIFGAGGMRVGLTGVFTAFPAFLFGPIYGGIVSGLSDLIGYIVKPDGAYIPWLTVMAFVGGFLKGALWKYVIKSSKSFRIGASALLLVCAVVGVSFHAALIGDDVQPGLIAVKEQLPTRGQTEQMELSPLASAAVSLAKYNHDVFTLTGMATAGETAAVPQTITVDGYERPLTKIGADAFADCENLNWLCIGSNVTSIDKDAFSSLTERGSFTVSVVEGSAADKAVSKMDGIAVVRRDQGGFDKELVLGHMLNTPLEVSAPATAVFSVEESGVSYTVKTSDTFRKYLAGYANFLTVGLEAIAVAGVIVVLLDRLIEGRQKKAGKEAKGEFLRIFAAIGISGVFVTAVNTEILRQMMAAWAGRSFLILLVPRVIEEIIVCVLQAYVISILYGIYVTKIEKKIPMLRNLK